MCKHSRTSRQTTSSDLTLNVQVTELKSVKTNELRSINSPNKRGLKVMSLVSYELRQIQTLSDNLDSNSPSNRTTQIQPSLKRTNICVFTQKRHPEKWYAQIFETALGAYSEECLILHPV